MKMWILNTGYLETDKNNVVGCSVIGTYSRPLKAPASSMTALAITGR